MNQNIENAKKLFYEGNYKEAKKIFLENNLTYEAGLSSLLEGNLTSSRKLFETKKDICSASSFGLTILDMIEDKLKTKPTYFQIRAFLEIYLNLFIENKLFNWAQKVINNYEIMTSSNIETPKFIARVLEANNYNNAVHTFAKIGREICFFDAEIHYIEALTYIKEKDYLKAKERIKDCKSFASDYYPILRLEGELNKIESAS